MIPSRGRKVGKQYSSMFCRSRLTSMKQLRQRNADRAAAQARYQQAVDRWERDNT